MNDKVDSILWFDAGQPDLMKLKNIDATDKQKKSNNYTKENA